MLGGAPHVSRGRVAVGGFSLARVWILLRALRCQLGQLLHRGWWLDLFLFLLPSVLACLGPSRCLIGVLLRVAPLGAGRWQEAGLGHEKHREVRDSLYSG